MKQVIVMRAIPGSGKSTYAKQLVSQTTAKGLTSIICSADDYFYELGKGSYAFDPSKIADAHKYCFKKFVNAVNSNIDLIIVDNTNLSAWEISPYKSYAEINDYDFAINEVRSDPGEAFKRQQHGVPQQAHERMSKSLDTERVPPWWNKEVITSKTSETGEPIFEKDLTRKANLVLKMAEYFNKIANK